MAKGDPLSTEEQIVRALWEPFYDPKSGRISSSAFKDKEGASVSRLAILQYGQIVDIYRRQFAKLLGTCVFSVQTVLDAVKKNDDFEVEVIEDPEEEVPGEVVANPAHALVNGYRKAKPATKDKPGTPREKAKFTDAIANHIRDNAKAEPIAVEGVS